MWEKRPTLPRPSPPTMTWAEREQELKASEKMCPCRSIQMGRWPAEPEGSDAVMWQNGLEGTRGLGPGAPASPRRARSAPACGVSRGPRASAPRFKAPWVRVPCMSTIAIIAMSVKRNGRLTMSKGLRHRAVQRRLPMMPPPAIRSHRQRVEEASWSPRFHLLRTT
jgi:hypothetical protein